MTRMRSSKQRWTAVGASSVLASVGVAFAQTPASPGAELPPPVGVSTSRDVALEPQAMYAAARAYGPRMAEDKKTIDKLVADSRKDVVKLLCLKDKQAQIDIAVRAARDRIASLGDAAERNDADRAGLEFNVATALYERAAQLVKEAMQCIGEEPGFIDGRVSTTMNIDPSVPDVDPSDVPEEPVDEFIPPPGPVSPTT